MNKPPLTSAGSAHSGAALAKLPYFAHWPTIHSCIAIDPAIEAEVARILSLMTLAEKVGQMIQPNLDQVTPEEAAEYKLGSLLNGGGTWPANNKQATAAQWAHTASLYWHAVERSWGSQFKIPFMWATDAVHGHNNVLAATVFPHNIGLGAANDAELIYRIGQATAREVAATGLDWTFAPTVAVPRDYRWGRTYEGYSEDPQIVYRYAGRMVEGLQGGAEGLKSDLQVISNVKHWVGDGGTYKGIDRGENHYSEDLLRNIHAPGYFAALQAGAQVVMSSFNSWHKDANYPPDTGTNYYNKKVHGSRYLITDVLKNKMGFDGIVVTDWNGHGEINDCTPSNSPAGVNAGNDIFMVTNRVDWQAFFHNVIAQVNDGTIPMSRIDDAVTRILRVKMRAGLWQKPPPDQRTLAGKQSLLGAPEHRLLAREAVRKSLVLLKNKDNLLPLDTNNSVYLTGSAANSIQKQTGGWSLTWQGTQNTLDDFPHACTLLGALLDVTGNERVLTTDNPQVVDTSANYSVAIVAIGEDPYAEFRGDIKDHQTLSYAQLKHSYAADLDIIKQLKAAGKKVLTILFSGRPLYVNEEINLSDAFVAAWLPGTQAAGITDVLYAIDGADFSGKLSYSWPATQCSTRINRLASHMPQPQTLPNEQSLSGEHAPLFAYGYGLSYKTCPPPQTQDLDNLPLDSRNYGCEQASAIKPTTLRPLELYGRDASAEFELCASAAANGWVAVPISPEQALDLTDIATQPINYQGQYDAVHVQFNTTGLAQIYLQYTDAPTHDLSPYLQAQSTLQFDIRMQQAPSTDVFIGQHCVWPCLGELPLNELLPKASQTWTTIQIPLHQFAQAGMDLTSLDRPFVLLTHSDWACDLANIRIVPGAPEKL